MKKHTITLGAGCFWCVEAVFGRAEGVLSVQSGYMGGKEEEATYEAVCSGTTDHAEVVQIVYDGVALERLLEVFWAIHDPTTPNRQGHDIGPQYRSVIFYHEAQQEEIIRASMASVASAFTQPLCTQVLPAMPFYPAESYHENYFNTHPHAGYCQAVITPKLEKFRRSFPHLVKKNTP